MDIVLEDSRELLSLTSPPPGREIIRYEVTVNRRNIEDICLCCGSLQVHTQHPLFEGGICASCKDTFLETLFLYDEDGHQSYCSICCSGDTLFICESPDCTRCYCFECVDILVGPGTSERINAMACWVCFLCLPFTRNGLLQRRRKWRHQLKAFHDLEGTNPLEMYKPVSGWNRRPVRVLSLFGNIEKELESLGFLERGSSSQNGRLKYVEDVTNVVRRDVEKWGPFDLVYGSTQPLGRSCDRCPGWYMFQFHRILQYAQPHPGSQQPFFWLFVDNLLLTEDDQVTATRFLQMEAVTLQNIRGRVLQNAVRVWSNIPGLKRMNVTVVTFPWTMHSFQEAKNVTPQDTQEFICRAFRKSTEFRSILKMIVRLRVAANFSTPVVNTSGNPTQGQEFTFTCKSTNGYPKPNLYWINRTDNSLIDETLQNNTVYLNERGLYDVVSTLRIPWVPHMNVSCCVENVVLHQNLTSISQAENSTGNNDKITENPLENHNQKKYGAVFSILAVLLVALVFIWVYRSRSELQEKSRKMGVEQTAKNFCCGERGELPPCLSHPVLLQFRTPACGMVPLTFRIYLPITTDPV
ncbi:hypothetical protein STEG23_004813 [Scotinomys teguina]